MSDLVKEEKDPKQYCIYFTCPTNLIGKLRQGVEKYLCCRFCEEKCRSPLGCSTEKKCRFRMTRTQLEVLLLVRELENRVR